ncbi:MAG: A/G-specific adenine glycosylase [Patescibacteria group bacterium]|nr:A/G-specific adenine glycosylase [Patescibacteria group bacterium]
MGLLSPQKIAAFQKHILDWYNVHKRDLPWRQTRDPYKILVSEVMSQQTQISRVIPKYEAWIAAFPTMQSVATAQVRDVLTLWSGLGYNRRALYLQKCAQVIVRDYKGVFPQDEQELLNLPGIGKYTAQALLCFAFNKQVAVLDTNVKKVILTQLAKKQYLSEKDLEEIAKAILPTGKAYAWNQALMDYAGIKLKKEKMYIPKQSKFKDSDRYFRGRILAYVLEKHSITKDVLFANVSQYNVLSHERFERILQKLDKETFIRLEGNNIIVGE